MRVWPTVVAAGLMLGGLAVSAAERPRVLVVAQPGNYTVRGLEGLKIAFDRASASEVSHGKASLFDYDVVIWGFDQDRRVLNADPERVRAFLEGGGTFLGFRCSTVDEWLPDPLQRDKAYHLGKIEAPDHPIFNTPHKFDDKSLGTVHGGSIYVAFYGLSGNWKGLVSCGKEQEWDKNPARDAGPHYGIVEQQVGKGKVLLCQMIPAYGWFKDANGDPNSPGAKFFENLVTYVLAISHRVARTGGHQVPTSFVGRLAEVMRLPDGWEGLRLDDPAWHFTAEGAYTGQVDRRGVYRINWPDQPSVKGSFAQLARTVKVPADAGRVVLRFYQSDDYCGGREPKMVGDRRVSVSENFKQGLRFKQVLVNGKPVWEEDVLGRNPQPAARRFYAVDITKEVQSRAEAEIALRVEDREGSGEEPFATEVYFAAVELVCDLVDASAKEICRARGFHRTEQGFVLAPQTEGELTFGSGVPRGEYMLAVQVRDEHTGQSALEGFVGRKRAASWKLTADDFGLYWATSRGVQVGASDEIRLVARRDGDEKVEIRRVALIPQRLLKPKQQRPVAGASPVYKPGPEAKLERVKLLVRERAGAAREQEVATQGIPFPYGALKSPDHLRVKDARGREVACQTRLLADWPDKSVKFALVSFPVSVAANGTAEFTLEYGTQVTRAAQTAGPELKVTETDSLLTIGTGAATFTLSKLRGTIVEEAKLGSKLVKPAEAVWGITIRTKDGEEFSSAAGPVTECRMIEAGPLRALIWRRGKHSSPAGERFEFTLVQEFRAGSSQIRTEYVFCHKEESQWEHLTRVWASLPAPWMKWDAPQAVAALWRGAGEEEVWTSAGRQATATVEQTACDRCLLTAIGAEQIRGQRAPGWARLNCGVGAALAVKWFWQTFPKALRIGPEGFTLDFLPPPPAEVKLPEAAEGMKIGGYGYPQANSEPGVFALRQGEAIGHEFVIRLDEVATEAQARDRAPLRAMVHPLRATPDPEYVCSTLALGEIAAADRRVFGRYEEGTKRVHDGYLAKREKRREYGMENFGDDTFEWGYGPSYTFWSNQEYDHHHAFLQQYVRSGDLDYFELGDQAARHYRDVDCIHWAPTRPDQLGGPRHHNTRHFVNEGWVSDHTNYAADVGHSWIQGLIDHWFLTGDPLSEEMARLMGDWYCYQVENNRFGAGGQERGQGWTLIALSAIYRATHDPRQLAAARAVAEWVFKWQDPIRGVISVPISEQPSYEGGTSFMHGILGRGLGRYYDISGDPRAKASIIGIANWLTTEAMGPPARFFYKQAPHCKGGRYGADTQTICALSYAYRLSGDEWFGDLTERLYNMTGPSVRSMAWQPQALYHLRPRLTPVALGALPAKVVASLEQPTQLALEVRNTASDQPLAVRWRAECSRACRAEPSQGQLQVKPDKPAEIAMTLRGVRVTRAGAPARVRIGIEAAAAKRVVEVPVEVVKRIVKLELGAKDARVQAPMVLAEERGGAFVHRPRDEKFVEQPHQAGEAAAGWAEWEVSVAEAGEYTLWADVSWVDQGGNSFWAALDEGAEVILGNDGNMRGWHWVKGPTYALSAGTHRLMVRNREDGSRLRKIVLVNHEDFVP